MHGRAKAIKSANICTTTVVKINLIVVQMSFFCCFSTLILRLSFSTDVHQEKKSIFWMNQRSFREDTEIVTLSQSWFSSDRTFFFYTHDRKRTEKMYKGNKVWFNGPVLWLSKVTHSSNRVVSFEVGAVASEAIRKLSGCLESHRQAVIKRLYSGTFDQFQHKIEQLLEITPPAFIISFWEVWSSEIIGRSVSSRLLISFIACFRG